MSNNTLSEFGDKFIKGQVTTDEFVKFLNSFKQNIATVRDEFKNKVEPAIYFNPDTKKLAEKSATFMSIFDDIENAIHTLESAIEKDEKEKFAVGFNEIIDATNKLHLLKDEIGGIMKTMNPT